MSHVVRIPTELYEKLKMYSQPFERPMETMNRILDTIDPELASKIEQPIKPSKELDIIYGGGSQKRFKHDFLKYRQAEVILTKTDGSKEIKRWNGTKFTEDSDVRANLYSGYLRGWRDRGIITCELKVVK